MMSLWSSLSDLSQFQPKSASLEFCIAFTSILDYLWRMAEPWQEYPVGKPSDNNRWVNATCLPFSTVSHVTHIASALNILRESVIQPQLADDRSVLDTLGIRVNWLSPNDWKDGSRYGNVSLGFDWDELFKGRKTYWAGTIKYNRPACRILVTDQNYEKHLLPYDPKVGDGPWWWDHQSGVHYRNGEICLEIMLETELRLLAVKEVDFVLHHPEYCCINRNNPKSCLDCGLAAQEASARFLAGVIAEDINVSVVPVQEFHRNAPNWWLVSILPENGYLSRVRRGHPESKDIARKIASAYYRRQPAELAALAQLFPSKAEADGAVIDLISQKFPLPFS